MGSEDTTDWLIWETKNTLEAIMGRGRLLEERPILTVLKASGVMLKPVGQSAAELGENRFILILRNANLDSMTGNLYHIMLRIFRKNPLF